MSGKTKQLIVAVAASLPVLLIITLGMAALGAYAGTLVAPTSRWSTRRLRERWHQRAKRGDGLQGGEELLTPRPPARQVKVTLPRGARQPAGNGTGPLLSELSDANAVLMVKVRPPVAAHNLYTKDAFVINLELATVTCPYLDAGAKGSHTP